MAHLRTFQTGKRASMSQELLNELSAAKVCLLDPVRKQSYDAQLRGAPTVSPPTAAINPAARGLVRPVGPPGGPAVLVTARPVGVAPRSVTAVASDEPLNLPRPMTSSL